MKTSVGSSYSKWETVATEIERQISAGLLPVGSRIPSETDIALQYNISRPTAHRALNELSKLGLVTRKPRVGTIVSSPKSKVRHSIALIADRMALNFDFPQAEFVSGIQEVIGQDYGITLFDSHGSASQEIKHIRKAAALTDGMILYPTCDSRTTPVLESICAQGFPMVLVDRVPLQSAFPCVLPDEETATKEAVQLMIEHGHKQIAFISFDKPEVSSVKKRLAAYRESILIHSLTPIERLLPRELETNDVQRDNFLRDVFFSLHKGNTKATAFFCVQDSIALGILDSCDALGIHCPEDIEVACFNEWPAMLLGRPWDIHRIVRRKREMGSVAAQMLLSQIHNVPFEQTFYVGATVLSSEPGPSHTSARGVSEWFAQSGLNTSISLSPQANHDLIS